MEVLGKDGLGSKLKKLLQIYFVIGIIVLVGLPFILNQFGLNMNASVFIIYPNGIILLLIAHKFIQLFDSLKTNIPFSENNVKLLKYTGRISFIGACSWIIDLLYEIVLIKSFDVVFILVMAFLTILYMGVSIALYILSELFKQATEYKKENELTI